MIHTKSHNRLAMKKLHKLVYVHYNTRLGVNNLMQKQNNEDFYNSIDLNHIFNDDDILNEWIQEGKEPILSSDNLDWLDKGLPTNEEVEKEMLIPVIKVRLLEQFLQVLVVMMVTIGAVGRVVALVRVLDEMVALGAVMLVKYVSPRVLLIRF